MVIHANERPIECYATLVNRHKWLNASIEQGDRIAQILIIPRTMVVVKEVQELPTTKRGTQGFGSTNSMLASRAKRKAINEFRRDEAQIEDKHLQAWRKTYRTQKDQVKKLMKEFSDVIATECLAVVWAVKQLRHYLPSTS